MKTLLITLGCSWTEGVGIYRKNIKNNKIEYIFDSEYMHQNGWPIKVGKKLGFDEVINLGEGKGSHSSQVKKFYEYINYNDLSDYNILVIFLMTDPVRISFYKNKKIKSYSMSDKDIPLMASYLSEIDDTLWDLLLEQKFYIQTLENICKVKNIDLILSSWNNTYREFIKIHHNSNHLFKDDFILSPPLKNNYSHCSHPNINGYDWISNKIVKGIKNNFKKWDFGKVNDTIKYSWIKTKNNKTKETL